MKLYQTFVFREEKEAYPTSRGIITIRVYILPNPLKYCRITPLENIKIPREKAVIEFNMIHLDMKSTMLLVRRLID